MPRTLTLVRHATTPANRVRRYPGPGDPGLDDGGRAEARRLARRLAPLLGPGPDRIWSSDLERARRTAELAFPGVPVRTDARLREMDFGAFGGRTYRENLERHGLRFRRWIDDPGGRPPPGGESLGELAGRLDDWLDELDGAGTVVAVTHGGPLRVLVARALGLGFLAVRGWRIPPAGVAHLHLGDGSPP